MSVAEAASGGRRGVLANVALAVTASALFLAGLEGVARLLVAPAENNPTADYIWDWEQRWDGEFYTMASASVGWPPGADEFNRDGLRDRRHAEEAPEGVERVAFLGDSVTFGHGIESSQAYPQRLQAAFDRAGRAAEVFNVGLWGWTARQQRIAYERIVRRYRPHVVVVAVCLNDIPEIKNNLTRPPRWLSRLHEASALVRALVDAPGREIHNVEQLFEEPPGASVEEGFRLYFEELRSLRRLVVQDGASFAMTVFPFRFQVEAGAPPPLAQERILAFCDTEGVSCLDLLPPIAAMGTGAFVDYDHLSPKGAELVAETLAAWEVFAAVEAPIDAVGNAGATRSADAWVRLAREEPEPELRRAAVWMLGQEHGGRATDPLAGLLQAAPSEAVRREAAIQLGAIGDAARSGLPVLLAALSDERASVRWAAAASLDRLGPLDGSAVQALAEAARAEDSYVRGFAIWTLGEMGDVAAGAVPALAEALRRGESGGRAGASAALAKLGEAASAAVPALVEELDHPRSARRWRAARTLGRIGPGAAPAVPRLAAALDDEDAAVRLQAARALGRIGAGAQPAIEALVAALESDDRELAAAASQALSSIPGR